MSETAAIKEHTSLFVLYDADGCLVGKANPGKKVMLADAFYVPERTCRMELSRSGQLYDRWRCTACGGEFHESLTDRGAWPFDPSFCPSCGAQVIE